MGEVVPAPWGAYFVTGFESCSQVLRDRNWLAVDAAWQERQDDSQRWNNFASQDLNRTLVRLNAPEHTFRRRSLGNLFDRAAMESLTAQIEEEVDRLLDGLDEGLRAGEADFVDLVADRLPMSTTGRWLDIPAEDHPTILEHAHVHAWAQELLPSPRQLEAASEAAVELARYFADLVRARRELPGEDPVSDWIRTLDGLEQDPAVVDEIVESLAFFIPLASLETTATLLTSTVWQVLREPGQWAWLAENPSHVDDAVDEVLRYDPPVRFSTRVAGQDMVLAGVALPKDTVVHVMYGAAGHDPRRNENPRLFDIRRGGSHLSFAAGIHYCLGAALARLVTRTLLVRLLERFPGLRVTSPPVYEPRMALRRVLSMGVSA
ncbi:cytochrome P450 [Streptomyces uncialis]|uniref:cytochrome P450 n=1 Tax=Streptomyces uncialis TaxID=1048205 RepID=UPI003830C5E1